MSNFKCSIELLVEIATWSPWVTHATESIEKKGGYSTGWWSRSWLSRRNSTATQNGSLFFVLFCFLLFLIINLFFIGVQFANIQNNTQCSPSVPITHSPHPLSSSPSTSPTSFPRVGSLYVLSPFLIFPTHFFSLPLYSLSLLFIFPKWMRTYNVCPSRIDLLHSA